MRIVRINPVFWMTDDERFGIMQVKSRLGHSRERYQHNYYLAWRIVDKVEVAQAPTLRLLLKKLERL